MYDKNAQGDKGGMPFHPCYRVGLGLRPSDKSNMVALGCCRHSSCSIEPGQLCVCTRQLPSPGAQLPVGLLHVACLAGRKAAVGSAHDYKQPKQEHIQENAVCLPTAGVEQRG